MCRTCCSDNGTRGDLASSQARSHHKQICWPKVLSYSHYHIQDVGTDWLQVTQLWHHPYDLTSHPSLPLPSPQILAHPSQCRNPLVPPLPLYLGSQWLSRIESSAYLAPDEQQLSQSSYSPRQRSPRTSTSSPSSPRISSQVVPPALTVSGESGDYIKVATECCHAQWKIYCNLDILVIWDTSKQQRRLFICYTERLHTLTVSWAWNGRGMNATEYQNIESKLRRKYSLYSWKAICHIFKFCTKWSWLTNTTKAEKYFSLY